MNYYVTFNYLQDSDLSEGGGIWITDEVKPQTESHQAHQEKISKEDQCSSDMESDDEPLIGNSSNRSIEVKDLRTGREVEWKIMTNLEDIHFIQSFHVCDICELRNVIHLDQHYRLHPSKLKNYT